MLVWQNMRLMKRLEKPDGRFGNQQIKLSIKDIASHELRR